MAAVSECDGTEGGITVIEKVRQLMERCDNYGEV